MKQMWRLVLVIVALGSPVIISGTVLADTTSITQELHVTARVLPTRRIIIDQTGQIMQITSNTDQNIVPVVFLGNDLPANRQPLTAELLKQFQRLTAGKPAKPGVLYTRPAAIGAAVKPFSLSLESLNFLTPTRS